MMQRERLRYLTKIDVEIWHDFASGAVLVGPAFEMHQLSNHE